MTMRLFLLLACVVLVLVEGFLPSTLQSSRSGLAPSHDAKVKGVFCLSSTDKDKVPLYKRFAPHYTALFVAFPVAAELFPFLLRQITNFDVDALSRQQFIIELLLYKRVYLYSIAALAVDWCARRSLSLSSPSRDLADLTITVTEENEEEKDTSEEGELLGQRLVRLNNEIFQGLPGGISDLSAEYVDMINTLNQDTNTDTNMTERDEKDEEDEEVKVVQVQQSAFNQQAAPLVDALNSVSSTQQAAALPVLVATALTASFAALLLSRAADVGLTVEGVDATGSGALSAIAAPALSAVRAGMALFSLLSGTAVVALFTKAEVQAAVVDLYQDVRLEGAAASGQKRTEIAQTVGFLSALLALFCTLSPQLNQLSTLPALGWTGKGLWPLQNALNVIVGVTISRAVLLPRLSSVLLALAGLVAYDVAGVYGTQQFMVGTDGGQSIMEAVAKAKIDAAPVVASATSAASATAAAAATDVITRVSSSYPSFPSLDQLSDTLSHAWRPGLLTVSLNGGVTDALGLGDVLFPALLVGWALRFDRFWGEKSKEKSSEGEEMEGKHKLKEEQEQELEQAFANEVNVVAESGANYGTGTGTGRVRGARGNCIGGVHEQHEKLYPATMGGYLLGCLLCEVFQTGQGQPALLYIVPSMLFTVGAAAAFGSEERKKQIWEFNG